MKLTELALLLGIWATTAATSIAADNPRPHVGESERVHTLATDNKEVRGLAVDDTSPRAPRLFTLDQSKIFIYRIERDVNCGDDKLELLDTVDLQADPFIPRLAGPRGLAFAVEDGHEVFYFLNWANSSSGLQSQLWRYVIDTGRAISIDLSRYPYRVGDREVLDLTYYGGQIDVCFDASGYTDRNLRALRGIVRYQWDAAKADLKFVRHMPDSGAEASRGMAAMEMDGARYFWGTVGNEQIYCAHGPTGRGLFFFDRPRSDENSPSCWGLCFGADSLWVSENVDGADRVHRVNVTKNLDAFYEGPRALRHLTMTLQTEPEAESEDSGKVYHYYSRPYAFEKLHNQGIWPETETLVDLSEAPGATLKTLTHDPAGDVPSRQFMRYVEYAGPSARAHSSKYEIDVWTNPYKKFVYPHRVNDNRQPLEGTDYLADDPELFNLNDTDTYTAFIKRVTTHVEKKYDVEADMRNPYWAARNIVEYIQDSYYYPNLAKRIPAAVDYDRKHYDANPGNLKIELSDRPYDKSQIIACSGTSVMVAGAMRHLGFPARWLGTGTQQEPSTWDANHNGLLDREETALSTNGHRYTQVWLGSHYGWICFDATPTKPDFNDYDPPPPLQTQWRYMDRAAGGHRKPKRLVFNVGSGLFRPLYRDFEYDQTLAIDNNCGGDQRYNLQGRFEKPELWKLARSRICLKNLCFVTNVKLSGPKQQTQVAWQLDGAWDKCPEAKLSLFLQQLNGPSLPRDVARLARGIPADAESLVVDLSDHRGKRFRLILRKEGDSETGGQSDEFDLE